MKIVRKVPHLPPRAPDAHKGDFGRFLVIAGSTGMVGAAALAGNSALRAGAGLVTIATPKSVYPILAAQVTCCTTHPLPETRIGTISGRALPEVFALAEGFDVVALGPGFGRHASTTAFVQSLVAELKLPMVIDADALNALADDPEAIKNAPTPRIITPHPGEMARLTGLTTAEIQKSPDSRIKVAARFAAEYGAIVVLKGHGTVVTDGERVFINPTGNPGMATGGTGDVLTGAIGALLAQGLAPFDAAILGAYIHGLAGDLAAADLGQPSLMASDLIDYLPQAFRKRR